VTLRKICSTMWEWANSNRGTILILHRGSIISEFTMKEWLLVIRLSGGEPHMLGPKSQTRQYCLYRNTLYTCPTAWRPDEVLERIIFPGNEDDLQQIKRKMEDAHARLMKSGADYQRQAEKSSQRTIDRLAAKKRSRYIPNRSMIAASIRTNGICFHCGERPIDCFDHLIPFSKGGSNEPHNIVGSCTPCNLKKLAKMPGEWDGGA